VPPRYDVGEHPTAVADVHEVLLHSTDSSSDAEGLGSFLAKLSPLTDTSTPPVCAAFAGLLLLTAGAAHSQQAIMVLHVPRRTAASARTVVAELLGERPH
jgi:hypothetical protein